MYDWDLPDGRVVTECALRVRSLLCPTCDGPKTRGYPRCANCAPGIAPLPLDAVAPLLPERKYHPLPPLPPTPPPTRVEHPIDCPCDRCEDARRLALVRHDPRLRFYGLTPKQEDVDGL